MAAFVWNYLSGYVMIKIEGLSPERLLNAASRGGVRMFAVRRRSQTELTAKIRPQDFETLRLLRKRSGCSIHILQKRGAPFLLNRMRMRKALLFGWIPLALAAAALSRFIWFVDVQGCYRVGEDEVYALLEEMGVRPGVKADALDHYEISRGLSAMDGRIAWAGASRRGVTLTVEIVEAEEIPKLSGTETAGSVYAAKDAVIKKITALKGRSVVSEGETVRKGELLITGELTSAAGIPYQVAARGEVLARVLYVATADVGRTAAVNSRSGVSVPYCRVSVCGRELFPCPDEYDGWEFETESRSALCCVLPLLSESGRLWQITETEGILSRGEQEERALRMAEEKAFSLLPESARVTGKSSEILDLNDGGVRAVVSIETEEDIAQPGPLDAVNTEIQDGV